MNRKTRYLTLLLACAFSAHLSATYYIAGNGADDTNGKWCNNNNWGFEALNEGNTITFYGVAAGGYGFKITDGSWGEGHEFTTIDYENSDAPIYGGNGSDIAFTLSATADVTVSLVDGKVRLTATTPLAYRSNKYYIAGNCTAFGNWSNNSIALSNDQISFSNLPAGWYEFKITNGTWDRTWGYTEVDAVNSTPFYKTYGDGNNICFRLTEAADVTVKIDRNKVVMLIDREFCITGNGNTIADNVWLAGHDWYAKDDDTKLDANHSRSFTNLPPGTYRFKIKDNFNAWSENNDCTWGYSQLDSENSITCTEDGDNNVQFVLSALSDVTISLVENKVRVTSSPTYVVAGNGNGGVWLNGISNWNASAAANRLYAPEYSRTYANLPAGEYEFKVVKGAWGEGNEWAAEDVDSETSSHGYMGAGANNIKFALQAATDVTITFNPETGKISLVSSNGYFLSNTYSVVGATALLGYNWANEETATEMTPKGDGTYEYIIRNKSLAVGDYEYKIIGGHSWGAGCEFPNTNATLSITEAGTYTVVFTLNPVTKEQTSTAYKQHDVIISAYGYSTFYSDKAYILPDGLKATIFTEVSGTALIGEDVDLIPANTGVLLSGTASETYTLLQTTSDVSYSENLFKGTTSDQTIAANGMVHYILGLNSGKCGLYWPSGTTEGIGAFDNKAGKAYLEIAPEVAPVGARGFVLRATDVVTSIEDTQAGDSNVFYDLLGRMVTNPQPGNVYICNGKKVVLF